jgi:hypothetical protein
VGGLTVNLASDNSAVASIPSTITIAEGQTTGKATITTTTVTVNTNATITASREGVSKTAILTVSPLLNTVSFNPSSLPGGEKSTGTVTLAGPAPSDTVVSLSSDNTPVASVPDTVTVLKDASTATFEVSTGAVANNTVVTIAASFGGVQKSAPITVQPLLKSVAFSPDHIFSTQKTTGTVTLNKAAAAGGHVVSLTSSNSTIAPVPATVTVPQGQLSADFEVIAGPVSENFDATITADLAGATASDTITVKPALVSIALSPDKVKIGAQSTATITLGAPAPAGGLVVTLTSDAEYATLSSASVTVLQGASTATVTVTGIKDTSNLGGGGSNAGTTPIRAALHGHEETARLTVKP